MSLCRHCGVNLEKDVPIERDGWYVDPLLNRVQFEGKDVHLTEQEVAAMFTILKADQHGITKTAIYNRTVEDEDVLDKIVDVIVCKLRKKMKWADPEHTYIQTVWGVGYVWTKETVAPRKLVRDLSFEVAAEKQPKRRRLPLMRWERRIAARQLARRSARRA